MKRALGFFLAGALSFGVQAEADSSAAKAALEEKLGIPASELNPAPIAGFFEVVTPQGLLYVSADGSRLIHGNVYDMDNGMVNLTEQTMGKVRQDMLSQVEDSMIVFPADKEKYVVTVFTDISCGYCRKLHDDMADYNARGITIRYLAFPRGGQNSQAWTEMEKVWCAKDQQQAMTQAKASGKASGARCTAADSVGAHYALGATFGVNGTPAMVLEDGTMVPGYLPPERLLMSLQSQ
ncbi:bifunctional protein-disulfide isomerase/oxidoreductase DsbC [Ferrimonas marina]|uniref:Thiol:disulfide interchange protein n=1 Tax=Ferrimonas marina TaxID=299255 RepID=A0A1M5VTI8_9GAMM|nr:bifunctional protein-disulfide isomerase/oxidoreductase DsbC [Ferrimonas marina]SHH78575.1 thiol:disulfide interchange protein DsbC [Ferrimonas marina]